MEVYKALDLLNINIDGFYQHSTIWKMPEKLIQVCSLVFRMSLTPLEFCTLKYSELHHRVQTPSLLGGAQSNVEQFQSAELKFFPAYDFPSYFTSHVILGFLRLDFLLLFQNLLAGESLVSRLKISLGSRGCLLSSLVSQH